MCVSGEKGSFAGRIMLQREEHNDETEWDF